MAITDISTAMQGLGTNPGMIIRAADFVAQGSEIVYDSEYFEGKAVRGIYTGQKIFETGWIPKGIITGNFATLLFMSEGSDGVTLSSGHDGVKIFIYRREDKTDAPEDYRITPISYDFSRNLSNASGSTPYDSVHNIDGNRYIYFNKEYEYKFVAYVDSITAGGYLDVEAIKLQNITSGSWQNAYQGVALVVTDEGPESIDVIDTMCWTITSDAGTGSANTGRIDITLPITLRSISGNNISYGTVIRSGSGFAGLYNRVGFESKFADIEGCVTEVYAGIIGVNQCWLTSKVEIITDQAWSVDFYGLGFPNLTQCYFTTTIFGAQFPIEV